MVKNHNLIMKLTGQHDLIRGRLLLLESFVDEKQHDQFIESDSL